MTWDVLRYDTVDSTNNVCKALAAQGLDSTAVIARAQTAGKGRLGRSFQSPEGGLYLSALWQDCPAGQLLTVTPLAAVAVCRAVESLCDTDCGIKWCNDVVLHGKKLCGILTESSLLPDGSAAWLVVGSASMWDRPLFRRTSRTWPHPLPYKSLTCRRTRWQTPYWPS